MQVNRLVLSFAMSIACGIAIQTIFVQTPASSEEYRGTVEQQLACTPDVWRLCFNQIPDTNRIVACLRENTTQLSGGCRAVFESNASVPPPTAPQQPAAPQRRGDQRGSYAGQ